VESRLSTALGTSDLTHRLGSGPGGAEHPGAAAGGPGVSGTSLGDAALAQLGHGFAWLRHGSDVAVIGGLSALGSIELHDVDVWLQTLILGFAAVGGALKAVTFYREVRYWKRPPKVDPPG
jgi:hypothetical protein